MCENCNTICGESCESCGFREKCKGCRATCGNPFGGGCIAAEYIKIGGMTAFEEYKQKLIDEINSLGIEGMPKIENLCCLAGFYVNLEYPLPNGSGAKLLDDNRIYLGTQVCSLFDDMSGNERCFGIVCDNGFILVAEYGANGTAPELVLFKRR